MLYQSIVQLTYVDKLLDDVKIKFRDMYKNVLSDPQHLINLSGTDYFDNFEDRFTTALAEAQNMEKFIQPKVMRNFTVSCWLNKFFEISCLNRDIFLRTQLSLKKL